MPKIERRTSRKEYVCSKCRNNIKKGEVYLKATPYMRKPIIRCVSCGIKQWETSTSEYVRDVGSIVDGWQETYGIEEDTANNIYNDLEVIFNDLQDRLGNMPEGLQYGEVGELLQSRIDGLEDALSNLESIDYESIISDAEQTAGHEFGSYDSDAGEYNVPEDLADAWEEKRDECVKMGLEDAINDALSSIEY